MRYRWIRNKWLTPWGAAAWTPLPNTIISKYAEPSQIWHPLLIHEYVHLQQMRRLGPGWWGWLQFMVRYPFQHKRIEEEAEQWEALARREKEDFNPLQIP